MTLFFQVVLFVLFVSWLVFASCLLIAKVRMEICAKKFDSQNITPSGSSVTHGMIRRGGDERGVIGNSKPSLAWYTRLLN